MSVLHVIDGSTDETQCQIIGTLVGRLRRDQARHVVCAIDPTACERAVGFIGPPVELARQRSFPFMSFAPRLGEVAQSAAAGIVHAWGFRAASMCAARLPGKPLLLTLLNPEVTTQTARLVSALPTEATVAVGSQVIRSRLLTAGLPPARVVVIRGPADFAAINAARRQELRQRVVGDGGPVVLMNGPATRGGGQFYGIWACAVVSKVLAGLRVILPYDSTEARRLKRFVTQIQLPEMLIVPSSALTWSQLVACADIFLCPAVEETCTEPLATAMAAGIPVVGTAVRSVAEVIADKHNGLLCKPKDPRGLAARLLAAIEDTDLVRKVTEVARGQAYEVFGIRDFADNYARLYENLLAGRPAFDGISDTAMVA
jgi:hypothetical protein